MSRSVPEWVGKTHDSAVPARVKARVFERFGGRCAISGVKLFPGEYDFDHELALEDGGEHREGNLRPVHRDRHREKTAAEAGARKKVRRTRLKHLGLWPKSPTPLKSGRGFPKRGEARK